MSDHDLLSPSRAHRFMRCAGSIREESKYPEPPSGPGAIDGTHSHTLLEHCVKADLADPVNMVGVKMKDHDGEFVVDAERAQRVGLAVDYVKRRAEEMGGKVISEKKVNPVHFLGRDNMKGTVDIQIHGTEVLEIADYKDGMNPVEVEGNEQLEIYALAALAELGLPVNATYPFKTVRMTIIQPKLALKGLKPIQWVEKPVSEILALIPKYVKGAAATEQPDAPLTPGDKQCRYCRAAGCSARAQAALSAAGVSFSPIKELPAMPSFLPVTEVSQQVAEQDAGSMPDDRLREIIEAAPLMRQMIEQAEAEAQRRLEAGKPIPGLKLVLGRGSQAWAIPEDQVVEKLKGMGVPKDAIYKTSVVSPAQAKKLAWEKRDGTKKSLSERQLKTLETEYIVKLAGKLTVAPESDPRPAVTKDASPLFGAVIETQPQPPALPDWLK